MEYQKAKSAAKRIEVKGPALRKIILQTMKTISDAVGATLGPGGGQVLIERPEQGLGPYVTKDGVTVMRSLGFPDSVQHSILEAARDAAVRTVAEAGDGTTTATVLAEAVVRLTMEYCEKNQKVSPQKVVRRLEKAFLDCIEPLLKGASIQVPYDDEAEAKVQQELSALQLQYNDGTIGIEEFTEKAAKAKTLRRRILESVARVSANGDAELAEAVLQCFELVGDDGNVTIAEVTGASHYEVEPINGYPIPSGLEDSCLTHQTQFINDPANNRTTLEDPVFLLYNGRISEIQSISPFFSRLGELWQSQKYKNHNIVLVANGFSDSVLSILGINFQDRGTLNIFPVVAPQGIMPNSQQDFLQDLRAITGATVFDPIDVTLDLVNFDDPESLVVALGPGLTLFESTRWRSNVLGDKNEVGRLERVDQLKVQLKTAESQLERQLLQERLSKLSGGIARLKVIGSSNGEQKEKRDRAEDAICAVRGAINYGCLPGGGWGLLKARQELQKRYALDPIIQDILVAALKVPVQRLLDNSGYHAEEQEEILKPIIDNIESPLGKSESTGKALFVPKVFDALEGKHVHAIKEGILDSTPAVLEAIRNALSIASLLGTLGGAVVFCRDTELERKEAQAVRAFERDAGVNEANERP